MISAYTFAMGHHETTENIFISTAKRIIIHDSYNLNGRTEDDIALVELNEKVDFQNDQFGFICLPLTHVNDNGAYPPIGTETYMNHDFVKEKLSYSYHLDG